jgi:hypothetical protein
MPKPPKPTKPAKPAKPHALPSYTLDDLPPAANKADHLAVIRDTSGAVTGLALSDGTAWLSVPVTGDLIPPTQDVVGPAATPYLDVPTDDGAP